MAASEQFDSKFYTRKELSRLTGLHPSTLSNLAAREEGPPCYSPAGVAVILYPRAEADAWMNGKGSSKRSTWGGARIKGEKKKKLGRRSKKDDLAERKRLDALCAAKQDNGPGEGGMS